jgi:HAD superfamily hydrolase (TIGR01509 family)
MIKALIFDVDGTIADTERAHMAAFNMAFESEGLPWQWSESVYRDLLAISGGKERIRHFWNQVNADVKSMDGTALQDTVERLHLLKTAAYEQAVRDGAVEMRPGVLALMQEAREAGLALAIATTTSPVNITALMRQYLGHDWDAHFAVIEDASTAPHKKPHPQVYLQTLSRLGLSPDECVAIEDSENGLRAAMAAGLATVITPNSFTNHHDFTDALRVVPDLGDVQLSRLMSWLN